jgi:hypothetical protein
MRFSSLRTSPCVLLATAFALTSITTKAETRCPGNIPGLSPRLVASALLVVPVKINNAGPFDFMVDTGSQLNVIDPALAARLGVKSLAKVGLVATTNVFQASVVVLDSLETGSRRVAESLAAVQDLGPIQVADPRIRGVLGENYLAHFDVLIDYPHQLLCLDETGMMRKEIRGERIPFVVSNHAENDFPFSERLVVSVYLSDSGTRPMLLQVDSGSDGPILYPSKKDLVEPLLKRATVRGPDATDARRAFAVLPPQDMSLGSRMVRKVPFVTPVSDMHNVPDREEDGILATVLFQRVYVSHSDHFIIFDPK